MIINLTFMLHIGEVFVGNADSDICLLLFYFDLFSLILYIHSSFPLNILNISS